MEQMHPISSLRPKVLRVFIEDEMKFVTNCIF